MTINFFEYALKLFLCIGIVFYCPVSGGLSVEEAVNFGYLSQELFFRFGAMVVFCAGLTQTPLRSLKFYSLPMFFVYALCAALLFQFPGFMQNQLTNLFMGVLFYKTVFEHLDFSRLKSYAWWIGWVLFINLAFCALQANGRQVLFSEASHAVAGPMDRMIGMMKLKVHLGTLAAISAPLITLFAPAFALCLIPMLVLGISSSAMIAFVLSVILLMWFRLPKKVSIPLSVLILLAGVAFVVFYDMPGGQFGERFKIWEFTLDRSLRFSPIIGSGIGSFKALNIATIQNNGTPIAWGWVHNEGLQALFEFGLIGIAILGSYLVKRYKEFGQFKSDRILQVLFTSCLSILIISFIQFPFHLGRFTHLIIFMFSGFHARVEDLKNA